MAESASSLGRKWESLVDLSDSERAWSRGPSTRRRRGLAVSQFRSFPIEPAIDETGRQQSLSDLAVQQPELHKIGRSPEGKRCLYYGAVFANTAASRHILKEYRMNQTMEKFGYPETVIREYSCWSVQLRPKQATLGSLVAICKEPARSFGQLSGEAFAELQQVTVDIEAVLSSSFGYAKLNYLMLMMTDPDVHFHVLPRYPKAQQFHGTSFADPGWPGPPDISFNTPANMATQTALIELLRSKWP